MKATYMKMRDGNWGVKVTATTIEVPVGLECRMEVIKKSGEAKIEKIKVLWIGNDRYSNNMIAICKIRDKQVRAYSSSGRAAELREQLSDTLGSHVEMWSDEKVLDYCQDWD